MLEWGRRSFDYLSIRFDVSLSFCFRGYLHVCCVTRFFVGIEVLLDIIEPNLLYKTNK